MLKHWAKPSPETALGLLDARFVDENIRRYAIAQLEGLNDEKVLLYLLQLVQVRQRASEFRPIS
jgi:hypothetical protein